MKVLLLDSSFAAGPIYDYLLSENHEVWTIGNRAGDLLAKRAGKRWIEEDYSNLAAVQHHVERIGIERVVPGCTDLSIAICSELPICTGRVDSAQTVRLLSNKAMFRELCREYDLPAPRAITPGERPTDGKWICKPADSFSGRGISVISGADQASFDEAVQCASRASPTGKYLVEEFVKGQLYSCTGFVQNRRLVDPHYVIEGSSVNPFAVDTSYVCHDVPVEARQCLESGLSKLCSAIGLLDGLLHTQFILDGDRAYIIECSRRCPGDLYSLLIEMSTGSRFAAHYASYFVGGDRVSDGCRKRHVLRHTVTGGDHGIFGGIRALEPFPLVGYYPLQRVGEEVQPKQASRCGVAFFETSSEEELSSLYQRLLDRNIYDVL
ncbi:acetyl-CoA carboxylase biotin carboxylase subunit family protein [Ruegeria sp. HKCCD7318]|uniref:ATP-grasp domain-containing protein n=1 Tax=Ruegeria sp. HKCCD7318 TaxID=2683014 RepID=UPI001490D61B|nr:hypothetical protein [Ruegeria sp. HKCCD7318]NOE34256.1 hypothetical protein [Ruegeria sp. HKCCD7318]